MLTARTWPAASRRVSKRRKSSKRPAGDILYETGLATVYGDKFLAANKARGRYMVEAACTLGHNMAEATCVFLGWHGTSLEQCMAAAFHYFCNHVDGVHIHSACYCYMCAT